MTQLTSEQQKAFIDACQVIDRTRAHEILQLKNWEHGMCGCLNPSVAEIELGGLDKRR